MSYFLPIVQILLIPSWATHENGIASSKKAKKSSVVSPFDHYWHLWAFLNAQVKTFKRIFLFLGPHFFNWFHLIKNPTTITWPNIIRTFCIKTRSYNSCINLFNIKNDIIPKAKTEAKNGLKHNDSLTHLYLSRNASNTTSKKRFLTSVLLNILFQLDKVSGFDSCCFYK